MNYKEDDLVLCRVDKVEGTTVFVDVEGKYHGSIVFSEIATGRIRNLREYVYPNKKIVCKVLRVTKDNLDLNFRRVTAKERDEVLERHKTEKAFGSVIKAIGEKPEKVIEEIKKEHDLVSFLDEAKANYKLFEKYVSKENA